MDLREPTAADGERIADLVERAMRTAYRLSPERIEAITREEFTPEEITAKVESDGTVVRVADVDEAIEGAAGDGTREAGADGDGSSNVVGYVEGRLAEPDGELQWLFVDPQYQRRGIGEALFDAGSAALTDAGVSRLRATTLEANAEGKDFFDRIGFERVDDRRVEVGDETLQEFVYADPAADATASDDAAEDREQLPDDPAAMDLPGAEVRDDAAIVRTDDGRELLVALEEMESGTAAPFFSIYEEDAREERYGYYCSNCGSLDVTMDTGDRIECLECGNDHAERSSEDYDGSYL